ncbi:MAG: hypothetical protein MI802_15090, partial [Desulfobacterales bacterium]|nr:hypothetical protein [Desulfobacterales bacterium]
LDKQRLESGLQSLMIYGFLKPLSVSETALLGDLFLSCDIPLEAARYYEDWIKKKQEGESTRTAENTEGIRKKILRIANAYRQGGQTDKALSWADRGIELKRGPELLRLKADLLYQEKRYRDAATAYGQLAEFKSHRGLACLMMGYAAWSRGDMKTAAEAFERAVTFPRQKPAASSALAEVQKASARHAGLATVQSSAY